MIAFHDDLWIEAERIRKEQQQERTRQRNRRKKQIKDLLHSCSTVDLLHTIIIS